MIVMKKYWKGIITIVVVIAVGIGTMVGVSAANPFSDVPNNTWYTNSVLYCYEKGYVGGYPNGSFRPNQPVTRAELAVILCAHAEKNDIKKVDTGKSYGSFKDCNNEGLHEWNHEPVHWAVSRGIIAGFEDNTIRLNDNVTREQAAVIFANYFEVQKISGNTSFADNNQISSWALSSVKGMVAGRHLAGTGGNMFSPKQLVTRAQICQIIISFANVIEDQSIPTHADKKSSLEYVSPEIWEYTDIRPSLPYTKESSSEGTPIINDRIGTVPSMEEENELVAEIEKEASNDPVYREKLAEPVVGMIAVYDNWGELEEIYIPNGDGTYYAPERALERVA